MANHVEDKGKNLEWPNKLFVNSEWSYAVGQAQAATSRVALLDNKVEDCCHWTFNFHIATSAGGKFGCFLQQLTTSLHCQ